MTADDIRARLRGYNPDAAKEQEAKGSHEQNRKFAPPWYEMFHFRGILHLEGVRQNRNNIDEVYFSIENPEVYEVNPKTQQVNENELAITLPKEQPGYPTDEINLMVEELRPHQEAADITAFDGLDVEMELDYEEHPWMKERDNRNGENVMVNGVAVPKRCWYYKTVAVFGDSKAVKAPETPKEASVKKLAEWCVGKEPAELTNASLARGAMGLKIQSDSALMNMLVDGPEKFLAHAATVGLVVGEDGKLALV
jgi:hypothetical protein